jgi:hypothetical protein
MVLIILYIFRYIQEMSLESKALRFNLLLHQVLTGCGHYRVVRDAADSVTAYQRLGAVPEIETWCGQSVVPKICGESITHRIHVWYINANIGGILMVNATIYSIHGSYGFDFS